MKRKLLALRPLLTGLFLLGFCTRLGAVPAARELLKNGKLGDRTNGRPVHWETIGAQSACNFSVTETDGEAILSVEVLQASDRPWAVQLRHNILEPVVKGETLHISFQYRMSPGYAFQCYLQKEAQPWPKYLSLAITEPFNTWRTCSMSITAPEDMPARNSSLCFHLAGSEGTVEFKKFSMAAFSGTAVAPEDLQTTDMPVIGGDAVDRTWRQMATARVDKLRKAAMNIVVMDGGKPVDEATVNIEQTAGDYDFGVVVPASIFPGISVPGQIKDSPYYGENEIKKLREFVTQTNLFSSLMFPELLGWRVSESVDQSAVQALLLLVEEAGLSVYGHALYSPAFRFAPPRCRQMTAVQLSRAVDSFVGEQAVRYKENVVRWNAVHAPLTYREMFNITGEQSLARVFKVARQRDPDAVLVLSDDRSLSSPTLLHLETFLSLLYWLQEEGAQVDALAFEAPVGNPYIAPTALEQRLDLIQRVSRDLPVYITGLAVDASTEALQAERLSDMMLLFYSYPTVKGLYFTDLWEGVGTSGNAGLFRRNMVRKPAAAIVEQQLRETWRTKLTAQTNQAGMVELRAFTGRYRVTLEKDGKRIVHEATLPSQGALITLDLAAAELPQNSVQENNP